MTLIWFERTRWFWQPITPMAWLVLAVHTLVVLLLNAWVLTLATDTGSTLYSMVLSNGLCFLWFDWLARRTSYRDGRKLHRQQRDPESWT